MSVKMAYGLTSASHTTLWARSPSTFDRGSTLPVQGPAQTITSVTSSMLRASPVARSKYPTPSTELLSFLVRISVTFAPVLMSTPPSFASSAIEVVKWRGCTCAVSVVPGPPISAYPATVSGSNQSRSPGTLASSSSAAASASCLGSFSHSLPSAPTTSPAAAFSTAFSRSKLSSFARETLAARLPQLTRRYPHLLAPSWRSASSACRRKESGTRQSG